MFIKNKRKNSNTSITLPHYLWAAKRGNGMSTLLNVFFEYLYAARAIEFCGSAKVFEFKLHYITPDMIFNELSRLDNTIYGFAGHNRYFKGGVCLDISEWIDYFNEDHFKTLLDYVADNSDKLLFVFYINTDNIKTIRITEAVISSKIRLETLILRFPGANELVEHIEAKFIKTEGFSFTGSAKALLRETIEELSEGAQFNGFKSITNLGEKIMFDILATEQGENRLITSEMLLEYKKDSDYVKNAKAHHGMTRVIGFAGEEVRL